MNPYSEEPKRLQELLLGRRGDQACWVTRREEGRDGAEWPLFPPEVGGGRFSECSALSRSQIKKYELSEYMDGRQERRAGGTVQGLRTLRNCEIVTEDRWGAGQGDLTRELLQGAGESGWWAQRLPRGAGAMRAAVPSGDRNAVSLPHRYPGIRLRCSCDAPA